MPMRRERREADRRTGHKVYREPVAQKLRLELAQIREATMLDLLRNGWEVRPWR